MSISRHPGLPWAATVFGTITFGFGIAYTLFPRAAFSTFGFPYPTTEPDRKLMDAVMVLYGMKDLYMGFSIGAATWLGNRKVAGLLLVAGAVCAGVDGYMVKSVAGEGEWCHWGYGPVMGLVGLLMMGLLG